MALVVIVTRDVAERYRGFLGSVMLEVAPTAYISPRMNPGIRNRVWNVLSDWHRSEPRGSLVMVWRDMKQTGGVGIATLGSAPRQLIDIDGLWLVRKAIGEGG